MKTWHFILIGLALMFLYQRQITQGENEETWEVRRDEQGRVVGVTVHRHYQGKA